MTNNSPLPGVWGEEGGRGLQLQDPQDAQVQLRHKVRELHLRTIDEVLLKRGRTSPTQLQVHLSSCLSTPIRACEERCTQTWTRVYLSWNCTRCTLQTSSPEPSLRGGGELVCKVHRVQFQPQCQRGGSQVPRCRACEARGTWLTSELTLGWVGWSSPPFLEYFIWVHRHYGHTRYG